MANGYTYRCKSCNREYEAYFGGMFLYGYEEFYNKKMNDFREGRYGSEYEQIVKSVKYLAIDDTNRVYICDKCGHWEVAVDLSLYRLKDEVLINSKDVWFKFEIVEKDGCLPYVLHYTVPERCTEEFELVKEFKHKCEGCGNQLRIADKEDLRALPCPYCGGESSIVGIFT